ncbi:MAG: hypothetical protein COT81_01550 [Candidatus Buchananbacteria bacterium CG10_big_fil_rev_8_21_14_0_10_42_9]|uniref:EfeO-type cupredoxin-like domain-containing protein n=1 Tax=Candidatus Buchananbacteria bacterium CG10_big_fil_rev_8_21_14_0_10_42_9 TaxID=1974526 RepID=A0A2H0W237_9BACT|nr:MAG: hypothetical protein COT81_01550 [Candidatus Buchananbacteria bacterium CG10_big_fil_rev_8_21_14_0_10_42_9]
MKKTNLRVSFALPVMAIVLAGCTAATNVNKNTNVTDTNQTPIQNINANTGKATPTNDTSNNINTGSSDPATAGPADTQAKVFEVSGKNFEFSAKEIKVQKGDTVTINFQSESGFHDWVVDEFNARTEQVNTGGKSSVTFVANEAGTFEYYCSVGQHRQFGMVGTLIVE